MDEDLDKALDFKINQWGFEEDDVLKPHEVEEAQAIYRASKIENSLNDICKGVFDYLKLEPNNPDKEKWRKVYQEANEIRKQYKKIREVL